MSTHDIDRCPCIYSFNYIFYFPVPPLNALKRVPISDTVSDDDAMSIAIVGPSDGSKALSSCCFPDLQLDTHLI